MGARFKRLYSVISDQIVLIGIVVVFFIVMSIASPYFLTLSNIMNIIQYFSTYGIISIGMMMVILTGGINLSVGGTMAISAYACAAAILAGIPWPIALIMALGVGMVYWTSQRLCCDIAEDPAVDRYLGNGANHARPAYGICSGRAIDEFPQ